MSFNNDITNDVSKTVYANLITKVAVPDYVKSAEVESRDSVSHLSPRAFADQFNQHFPLNTKASCWTSALYFYGQTPDYANSRAKDIHTNLTKHAEVWGISDDVDAVREAFAPVDIPAKYALSFEYRGDQVDRCPCHTPNLAKQSCVWLSDHKNNFPISEQIKAACTLIEKAGGYENVPVEVQDYIGSLAEAEKYATSLNVTIASAINERLASVKRSDWGNLGEELLKIATDLSEDPYSLNKDAHTMQSAIEAFDIQSGLQQRWGKGITHPVDACYSITRSKAASAVEGSVKLMNGNYFNVDEFSQIDLEEGLKRAGDDFLSYAKSDGINLDMSKVKEILPTMPAPDANRFEAAFPETTTVVERLG
jgi:hypothetical protein